MPTLVPESEPGDLNSLRKTFNGLLQIKYPRHIGEVDAYVFDSGSKRQEREVEELRGKLQGMKIVARAKVTQDRVYSAAYHPEPTKDLIFFGGGLQFHIAQEDDAK